MSEGDNRIMKRLVLSLTLAGALTAVGFGGRATHTASADATNPNARCVGQFFSGSNPGFGRSHEVSGFARQFGGVGQVIGPAASSNNCSG
jgi:hypothetical protein